MSTDWLIVPVAYLGVVAGAVSGVMEARRKKMDVVGACVIGLITALGGGTVRDVLLGRMPVFWVLEPSYAWWAFLVALVTFYSTGLLVLTSRSILVPDALGLGVFSIVGASYGIQMQDSLLIAALMGVITGVFGGILRDVLCAQIPVVFARSTQLYATCSFVGAWVYLILLRWNVMASVATLIGIFVVVVMRLMAVRLNWRLPDPED
ncbi:MAG: trimeric intracellular cation channel family protein [Longilinea sp.]|nr:trimeric intracellular cation channel family protein [Longilinea sp.]MCA1954878.1 trimeric intracellular cation channel family protein [Anaerolinea sp.]